MECEACDINIAVWSVYVDEKRTTTFAVCDDCFNEHKVCWTAFVSRATCLYCDSVMECGREYCSFACKVNDCGCKADPTCCGDDE
jgi:hypothetical protein